MILTTLQLGRVPGRARRRVVCRQHQPLALVHLASWRSVRATAPAFGGFRATRLAVAGYMGDVDGGELSICINATATTDATAPNTKRPARHLGTRAT
jgi:hypothetical protein